MANPFIQAIIDSAADFGIRAGLLAETAGLSDAKLRDGNALSDSEYDRLVGAAIKLCKSRLISLVIGSRSSVDALGVLGYTLMSCETVGDALDLFLRYHKWLLPRADLSLQVDAQFATMTYHTNLAADSEIHRMEIFFAGFGAIARFLLAGAPDSAELRLTISPPDELEEYQRLMGAKVHFNNTINACVFERHWLEKSLATANPELQELLQAQCESMLASMQTQHPLSNQVRRLLIENQAPYPNITTLASHFNICERTLRRRLRREQSSYQQLLDQVRMQMASEYLSQTMLPATEIGGLLGYDEPANFRRAFRRWFGLTPSKFRSRLSTAEEILRRSKMQG